MTHRAGIGKCEVSAEATWAGQMSVPPQLRFLGF